MAHIRSEIRTALANQITPLLAADTADLECQPSADFAVDRSAKDGVFVDLDGEQTTRSGNCVPDERLIAVRVVILVRVKGGSTAALDRADDLALLVERAVAADPTLGGLVEDMFYRGCGVDHEGSGEHLARIDLSFDVQSHKPLAAM